MTEATDSVDRPANKYKFSVDELMELSPKAAEAGAEVISLLEAGELSGLIESLPYSESASKGWARILWCAMKERNERGLY